MQVPQYLILNPAPHFGAIGNSRALFRNGPLVVLTKSPRLQGLEGSQGGANVGVLPFQRLPLGTVALFQEVLGQDAELFAVHQRLPVGVVGRCYKQRVDLVLTIGATLDLSQGENI